MGRNRIVRSLLLLCLNLHYHSKPCLTGLRLTGTRVKQDHFSLYHLWCDLEIILLEMIFSTVREQ